MLAKRINNTLNEPLKCMKKMSEMKWNDLKLPKPSYKNLNLNYAKVIE